MGTRGGFGPSVGPSFSRSVANAHRLSVRQPRPPGRGGDGALPVPGYLERLLLRAQEVEAGAR